MFLREARAHETGGDRDAPLGHPVTGPSWEGFAIEIKRSLAPKPERGFHQACADLGARKRLIVYPGEERFAAGAGMEAVDLTQLMHELRRLHA